MTEFAEQVHFALKARKQMTGYLHAHWKATLHTIVHMPVGTPQDIGHT